MDIPNRDELQPFFDQIQRASSIQDLYDILDRICDSFGFEGYNFYHYNCVDQSFLNRDTRPAEYMKVYEELGGIYNDPVAYLTTLKPDIFRWDAELTKIELGENQLVQLGIARDFDIKEGISASVFSHTPIINAFSWYSNNFQYTFDVYRGHADTLNLLAKLIAAKLESFTPPILLPKLTPREREILHWIARGKTSEDTADILAIATATVDGHLRSAMRKLCATNRTHAVAKAITLRLITL